MSKKSLYILTATELIKCKVDGVTNIVTTKEKDFNGIEMEVKRCTLSLVPVGDSDDDIDSYATFNHPLSSMSKQQAHVIQQVEELGENVVGKTLSLYHDDIRFSEPFYVMRKNSKTGKLELAKNKQNLPVVADHMPMWKLKGEGPVNTGDALKKAKQIFENSKIGGGFVEKIEISADGSYKDLNTVKTPDNDPDNLP